MTNLILKDPFSHQPATEDISTWSTDQLYLFGEYYESLIAKIEYFIDSNKRIYDHITQNGCYFIENIHIDCGTFEIALEEHRSCSCCRRCYQRTTSMPIEWYTEGTWKEYFAKIDKVKAKEERVEQKKKDEAADVKRKAKEEKDKKEYQRLKEKFE